MVARNILIGFWSPECHHFPWTWHGSLLSSRWTPGWESPGGGWRLRGLSMGCRTLIPAPVSPIRWQMGALVCPAALQKPSNWPLQIIFTERARNFAEGNQWSQLCLECSAFPFFHLYLFFSLWCGILHPFPSLFPNGSFLSPPAFFVSHSLS